MTAPQNNIVSQRSSPRHLSNLLSLTGGSLDSGRSTLPHEVYARGAEGSARWLLWQKSGGRGGSGWILTKVLELEALQKGDHIVKRGRTFGNSRYWLVQCCLGRRLALAAHSPPEKTKTTANPKASKNWDKHQPKLSRDFQETLQ